MHPMILLQRAASRRAGSDDDMVSVNISDAEFSFTVPASDNDPALADYLLSYVDSPPPTSSSSSSISSASFPYFHPASSVPPSSSSQVTTPASSPLQLVPDVSFETQIKVLEQAFQFIPPMLAVQSNSTSPYTFSPTNPPSTVQPFELPPPYPSALDLSFLNNDSASLPITSPGPTSKKNVHILHDYEPIPSATAPKRKKARTALSSSDIFMDESLEYAKSQASKAPSVDMTRPVDGFDRQVQSHGDNTNGTSPLFGEPFPTMELAQLPPPNNIAPTGQPTSVPVHGGSPQWQDDPEVQRMIQERYVPPALIVKGIVSPEEVQQLFTIFFERMNPHVHVLDSNLHTIPVLLARSPLLFTVICALASRHLSSRPDLYPVAMNYAKKALCNACFWDDNFLGSGCGKTTADTCLALVLFSLWAECRGPSSSSSSCDRRCVWSGLAVRMAEDLVSRSHVTAATATAMATCASTNNELNEEREILSSVIDMCRTHDRAATLLRPPPPTPSIWNISSSAVGSSNGVSSPHGELLFSSSSSSFVAPVGGYAPPGISSAVDGLRSTTALTMSRRRIAATTTTSAGSDGLDLTNDNPESPSSTSTSNNNNEVKRIVEDIHGGIVSSMMGILNELARPVAPSGSGNTSRRTVIQKAGALIEEFEREVKSTLGRLGDHPHMMMRKQNLLLDVSFYRLVVYLYDLQAVLEDGASPHRSSAAGNGVGGGAATTTDKKAVKGRGRGRPSKAFLARETLITTCVNHARSILSEVSNDFAASGFLQTATERTFSQITAVALFVIKIMSSPLKTSSISEASYHADIDCLVQAMQRCAVDQNHTPAVYARCISDSLRVHASAQSTPMADDASDWPSFLLERASWPLS